MIVKTRCIYLWVAILFYWGQLISRHYSSLYAFGGKEERNEVLFENNKLNLFRRNTHGHKIIFREYRLKNKSRKNCYKCVKTILENKRLWRNDGVISLGLFNGRNKKPLGEWLE